MCLRGSIKSDMLFTISCYALIIRVTDYSQRVNPYVRNALGTNTSVKHGPAPRFVTRCMYGFIGRGRIVLQKFSI